MHFQKPIFLNNKKSPFFGFGYFFFIQDNKNLQFLVKSYTTVLSPYAPKQFRDINTKQFIDRMLKCTSTEKKKKPWLIVETIFYT